MLGLARYVKSKTLKLTSRILTRSRRWLVSVDKIKSGHVISSRFKVPGIYVLVLHVFCLQLQALL